MGHITNDGRIAITGSDDSCPGGVTDVNTETLTGSDGGTLTITGQNVVCPIGPGKFHGTARGP